MIYDRTFSIPDPAGGRRKRSFLSLFCFRQFNPPFGAPVEWWVGQVVDAASTVCPRFVQGLSKVCPMFVHVQRMSKLCPHILEKSHICPTFAQGKSTVCPEIVYTKQLCPNNFTLDTPWTQDFLRFVQTLSTQNPSLPAPHQTSVLRPSFVRIQCLSRQKKCGQKCI